MSDSSFLHFQPPLQQGERILEQRHDVHLREAVLLGMRIGEKVGDDVVEPLRFASDDLQQAAMLVIQAGNLRKQSGRSRDGSKRIANFMGDGGGETSNSCQPVLHSDLAFEAAYLGQVIEGVNKSQLATPQNPQFGSNHPKRLAEIIRGNETDFPMRMLGAGLRQRVYETAGRWAVPEARSPAAVIVFLPRYSPE